MLLLRMEGPSLARAVLRQYEYVQTWHRPPTNIEPLAVDDVAMTFTGFALHVLSQQQRGHPVLDNELWAHSKGYMRWFIRLSHPIVNPSAAIPDYTADAPCNTLFLLSGKTREYIRNILEIDATSPNKPQFIHA
jgi:hypothetical protein